MTDYLTSRPFIVNTILALFQIAHWSSGFAKPSVFSVTFLFSLFCFPATLHFLSNRSNREPIGRGEGEYYRPLDTFSTWLLPFLYFVVLVPYREQAFGIDTWSWNALASPTLCFLWVGGILYGLLGLLGKKIEFGSFQITAKVRAFFQSVLSFAEKFLLCILLSLVLLQSTQNLTFLVIQWLKGENTDSTPFLFMMVWFGLLISTVVLYRFREEVGKWMTNHDQVIWSVAILLLFMETIALSIHSPYLSDLAGKIKCAGYGYFIFLLLTHSVRFYGSLAYHGAKTFESIQASNNRLWNSSKFHRMLFIFALALLAVYLAPFLVFGHDTYVLIHDNLDHIHTSLILLVNSGKVFAGSLEPIPQMFNGIPRGVLHSEWNLRLWLYTLFDPFVAYTINQFLMRIVAFFGMLLLLDRIRNPDPSFKILNILVASGFSLLPFWPENGLGIAGQPMALYAFLSIRDGKARWPSYLFLFILPFYAEFFRCLFFFLILIGGIFLVDLVRYRKPNLHFFGAIVGFSCLTLWANYRMLWLSLTHPFVSHRAGNFQYDQSVVDVGKTFLDLLINGQYHAHSLHFPIVLLTALLALSASLIWTSNRNHLLGYFALFLFVCGVSAIAPMIDFGAVLPFLKGFNFSRFYFLLPLASFLLFAEGLSFLASRWKKGRIVVATLALLQVFNVFAHSDYENEKRTHGITYAEFYAEEQFAEIRDFIGRSPEEYRVVSIGMHPAIAQYNGFYTLDGYWYYYPLSYKKAFREIIAPELKKNEHFRKYYDSWGSRAYLFLDDLEAYETIEPKKSVVVRHLDLNVKALQAMGGEYVISSVKIENCHKTGLVFLKKFTHFQSAWDIYLYSVKPAL